MRSLRFILPILMLMLGAAAYWLRPAAACQLILVSGCPNSSGQALAASGSNEVPLNVAGSVNPSSSQMPVLRKFRPVVLNSAYTAGNGLAPATNAVTRFLLGKLGYNEHLLWQTGIIIKPHDGPIPLRCSTSGYDYVQGLAVKPNQTYLTCSGGGEMIDASYRTSGKCVVVYNWQNYRLDARATGNSEAVLAHELGHCLDFIYGEGRGLIRDLTYLRPKFIKVNYTQAEEIIADDFMICRHKADTNWGDDSYYVRYGFARPTASLCKSINVLFNKYYPL